MSLRLPQAELVAAVSTDSPHNWGSLQLTYGAQFRATVQATRTRRDLSRTGFVLAKRGGTAPDSLTPSGFGPFGPVVIGQAIVRGRNRYLLTRSRVLSVPSRRARYALEPPQVVAGFIVFRGPRVLRNRSRLDSDARRKANSILRPPRKINPPPTYIVEPQVFVHLASLRQRAFERVTFRAPHYRLAPPVVVSANPTYAGPAVRLTDPANPTDIYWRREPKSKLSPPEVVDPAPAPFFAPPIVVTTVTITPPRIHSRLSPPPTIIDLTPQVSYLSTTFARITPPPTVARLSPPTDTVGLEDQGKIRVTLVRIKPPRTLAGVRRPRFVAAPVAYLRPIDVTLARSSRGKAKSRLPQVVVEVVDTTLPVSLAVTLSPSRRPVAKSRLSLTQIIDLQPQVYVLSTTLARIVPPPTISRLSPPTDTAGGLEDQGQVAVTLAYSLRGRPKSRLHPPTDIVDEQDKGHLEVTLAPSPTQARRAHWKLGPPTVVTPSTPHRAIVVELARTPRQFIWMQGYGIAGVRRPRLIRAATPYLRPIQVTLARIKHPPVKWRLAPPSTITPPVIVPPEIVQLVRNVPPGVASRLGPPTVIDLSPQVRYLTTWLAYSRRGRPIYRLGEPTDLVDAQDLGRVRVTLARNKVKPTRYRLRPPAVIIAQPLTRPIKVTLARIRPPRTILLAPGVIYAAPLSRPVKVTLAPSVRGRPIHFLKPPTVIDTRPQVFYLQTTFVRIRPVKTHWLLRLPTVIIDTCYGGEVCGFDFAAEVCGVDAGALAQGTVTGSTAIGSDTGATAEGATASRGSVSGDDARREGC